MSQVWQCDRCEAISKNGNVDDPPDGWETYEMPVRGSEGARSTMNYTLCGDCEDSLYAWLHKDAEWVNSPNLRRPADRRGLDGHCPSCSCVHEECGYVVNSLGCEAAHAGGGI